MEVKGYKNILNLPDFQKKSYPAIKPETRQRIRGKIMACARLFFFKAVTQKKGVVNPERHDTRVNNQREKNGPDPVEGTFFAQERTNRLILPAAS